MERTNAVKIELRWSDLAGRYLKQVTSVVTSKGVELYYSLMHVYIMAKQENVSHNYNFMNLASLTP